MCTRKELGDDSAIMTTHINPARSPSESTAVPTATSPSDTPPVSIESGDASGSEPAVPDGIADVAGSPFPLAANGSTSTPGSPAIATATPAMRRYLEVKEQYPGTLLLYRIGDFYELFYEDAEIISRALGLTLTSRDKGSTNPIPMAGFPYQQLDNYLRRLVQAGYRAAICEQMEDAAVAKGIVKREVTRVVTPGTLTDDSLLDPRESNFLCACVVEGERAGLAWLELSTGRFIAADLDASHLADELARLNPAECLIPDHNERALLPALGGMRRTVLTRRQEWRFAMAEAKRTLLSHFGTRTLEGFGWSDDTPALSAAGGLLEYVQETQRSALPHITLLEPFSRDGGLLIDEATRRSLELTRTIRENNRDGSLLAVLDETATPMGARLLAEWLSNPLTDPRAIGRRLDAVGEFVEQSNLCQQLRTILRESYDVLRLTARVATGRASPRDLRCLASSLAQLPALKAKLVGRRSELCRELEARLDLCGDIRSEIDSVLVDEPPLAFTDGGIVRPGYSAALDELRDLARGGKEWIARYQAQEAEATGIPGLKVGFNKVFGYYIELTAAQAARTPVPAHWIRKQTLKNQERFITPQLKEHEDKVLRSEQQSAALENELFQALRTRVAAHGPRLTQSARAIAELDVLTALAALAVKQNYCRPNVVEGAVLDIRDGRHPVLDRLQPSGQFVPNDVRLGGDDGLVQIITGPNMAGKSTYIRQAALLTIMAQIGSWVPAKSATIGIADRIFARVGASDELGRGQSTFMVEMTETARILNAATNQSLVILDEIGRGTSTYDGISLAWAVTEYLHDCTGSRTLFATHYHELTELTTTLKQARNWNVAVRETTTGIIFLHKIVPGAADKSYGIHVARLAGVPGPVVERAQVILKQLEADHLDPQGQVKVPTRKKGRPSVRQLRLFPTEEA